MYILTTKKSLTPIIKQLMIQFPNATLFLKSSSHTLHSVVKTWFHNALPSIQELITIIKNKPPSDPAEFDVLFAQPKPNALHRYTISKISIFNKYTLSDFRMFIKGAKVYGKTLENLQKDLASVYDMKLISKKINNPNILGKVEHVLQCFILYEFVRMLQYIEIINLTGQVFKRDIDCMCHQLINDIIVKKYDTETMIKTMKYDDFFLRLKKIKLDQSYSDLVENCMKKLYDMYYEPITMFQEIKNKKKLVAFVRKTPDHIFLSYTNQHSLSKWLINDHCLLPLIFEKQSIQNETDTLHLETKKIDYSKISSLLIEV